MSCVETDSNYSKLTIAYNDAEKCGKINIVHIQEEDFVFGRAQVEKYSLHATEKGEPISGIDFSRDGTMLNIAVQNGIFINTYSVSKRYLVKRVGRGKSTAIVNSISSDSKYMACCSDRGTTHIFDIKTELAESTQDALDSQEKNLGSSVASNSSTSEGQGVHQS